MKKTQVARLLAYVTGMVNQQLLLQNEYLIAENRILRSHLPTRLRLTDPQRATLATIGKRLGRQALQQVALVAKPETILGWYRKLIAQKFDGSKHRAYSGRPTVGREITGLGAFLAITPSSLVRIGQSQSGRQMRAKDPVLCNQVFILQQELLVHHPGTVRQQPRYLRFLH